MHLRQTPNALQIVRTVAAGIAVCCLGAGCSRAPQKPSAVLAPPADLSIVARSHLFAGQLATLQRPQSLSRQKPPGVPAPVPLSALSEAHPLQAPDFSRIERGLRGRLALVNSRYAASVRQREERSAQVAIRQAREKLTHEMDDKRQELKDRFSKDIIDAQLQGADEKRKVLFEMAILRSKIRVTPGGEVAALQQKLDASQARVDAIEQTVHQSVSRIRQEYQANLKALDEDLDRQMEEVQKEQLSEARQRADRLASERAESTTRTVSSFMSGLGQQPGAPAPSLSTVPRKPPASPPSAPEATIQEFQRVARLLRTKIEADASLSVKLARANAAGRQSPGTKKSITRTASRLVSGRL